MDPQLAKSYSLLGLVYNKRAELEAQKCYSFSTIISTLELAEENLQKAVELDPSLMATVRSDLESILQKKEMYKRRMD